MPSKPYRSVALPAPVGTCSQMKVCGLVQSNCSTVPVTDLLALKSNMANEWWASAGAVAPAARESAIAALIRILFMAHRQGGFVDDGVRAGRHQHLDRIGLRHDAGHAWRQAVGRVRVRGALRPIGGQLGGGLRRQLWRSVPLEATRTGDPACPVHAGELVDTGDLRQLGDVLPALALVARIGFRSSWSRRQDRRTRHQRQDAVLAHAYLPPRRSQQRVLPMYTSPSKGLCGKA